MITTKSQYEKAKFLGRKLTHKHKWNFLRLNMGTERKPKMKTIVDATGGFIVCSICGRITFLNPEQIRKFKEAKKAGYALNIKP